MKYKVWYPFIAFFLFVGCAGADVMLLDPSKTYSPTENVRLLLEDPEEEYEIIAIVEAKGSQYNNQSEVVRAAQKEAGKIGAHAIIPMNTEKKGSSTPSNAKSCCWITTDIYSRWNTNDYEVCSHSIHKMILNY